MIECRSLLSDGPTVLQAFYICKIKLAIMTILPTLRLPALRDSNWRGWRRAMQAHLELPLVGGQPPIFGLKVGALSMVYANASA